MFWLRLGSLICLFILSYGNDDVWQRPGCHKVGNTRKITIPDCVSFTITTNACRGFCESYSVPSLPFVTTNSLKSAKKIVSVGQCCNMMESEQIEKRVYCVDGERTLTFKSAVSCSCYHCKKN